MRALASATRAGTLEMAAAAFSFMMSPALLLSATGVEAVAFALSAVVCVADWPSFGGNEGGGGKGAPVSVTVAGRRLDAAGCGSGALGAGEGAAPDGEAPGTGGRGGKLATASGLAGLGSEPASAAPDGEAPDGEAACAFAAGDNWRNARTACISSGTASSRVQSDKPSRQTSVESEREPALARSIIARASSTSFVRPSALMYQRSELGTVAFSASSFSKTCVASSAFSSQLLAIVVN